MPYFQRRRTPPPPPPTYAGYRLHVREDFRKSCAYCLLEEIHAGGQENFELDHFKPKSLSPADAIEYYNLYYACHVCNRIKHDKWPSAQLKSRGITFVDLCSDEFESHFRALPDGCWLGLTLSPGLCTRGRAD